MQQVQPIWIARKGPTTSLRSKEKYEKIWKQITGEFLESIFLADEVVVLSGRPATNQYSLKIPKLKNPKLDSLFSKNSIDMLKSLRKQIEIAQVQQGTN